MSKITADKFNTIVKKRANERAQALIVTAKKNVTVALASLVGINTTANRLDAYNLKSILTKAKPLLAVLMTDNHEEGWPKEIWDREEDAVEKELLSVMDEMQKALMACDKPENPGDCKPV